MPIDRVRRIPPDAIEHLASRPELWQSCTATRITPARLRSEVPEETLDLYENRVAATLVRRILRWLAQRIGDVDRAYYQTEMLHKSLFTGYQYNFRREQRIKTLWKQLDTVREQEYLQQYEKSRELKDKISRQAAEISTCLDSLLYKNLCGKPDVVSPLKPTNILTMDSDYRRIKHLWEIMDRFDSSPNTPEQVSNQRDIQSDYACYVYGCVLLSLRWIGFLPAHTKPENFPDELDFNRALQWERWTVSVKPPEQGTFNINIDFIWEPMLNGTGGGISQKTKSWQNHPTRIRLVVVPIARSLFGNQDEVGETLNKLYKNSLNQVRKTSNPPKRKNRKDLEVQTYVQLVHPSDPRDPNISEDVPPELIQRMLSIGENFMHPDDYKSFVLAKDGATPNVNRIGCFPASPLDLNTLERFQRLFRFHTLGVDLLYGIHPASCPVCDYDLKDVLSNFKDESGFCPSCNAEWSWRICRNCDRKVPKLQPQRMKPASQRQTQQSYAVHAMAREQLLSRDQLSALCESDEVPESGNTRVICPHCGACTGRGETAQKCRRCRDNRFGQG